MRIYMVLGEHPGAAKSRVCTAYFRSLLSGSILVDLIMEGPKYRIDHLAKSGLGHFEAVRATINAVVSGGCGADTARINYCRTYITPQ